MTEVEVKLRDFLKEIAEEKGYSNGLINVQAISSEGANYSSDLYLATISAPPKEDLKLFAKVAKLNESVRAALNDMPLYESERFFYEELANAFEEIYNKHGVSEKNRLYIPKYFGFKSTEGDETLVLENLTVKGFRSFDRMKTFDWDYASRSVEELAKFHALGLAYKEENRDKMENMDKLSKGTEFFDKLEDLFTEQTIKVGTQLIKEEYRSRMKTFLETNNLTDQVKTIWMSTSEGFLIHGDYRPSNLMHRRLNGKIEVVPLDYQTYRLGPLASDLMYFIYSGSDAHFRKYHYQQLLEHYYTELTLALQNLGIDINNAYPREKFEQELEDTKTMGLFIGLTMVSLLTVEPENAPLMADNFESMIVTPNQLALDRVNGIVADYIRWGIII